MNQVMIVPAAGRGSRLCSEVPKLLVSVNGRPMFDHVIELYRDTIREFVVVVNPLTKELVQAHCSGRPEHITAVVQSSPTGMLDAILVAREHVQQLNPTEVWVTWCDQIAVLPKTIGRLAEAMTTAPALALPTLMVDRPYIHFGRSTDGSIAEVRQRREGDPMPEHGETDIGLFALSAATYLEFLPQYAGETSPGALTGERNFLPFVPWMASRAEVCTVPATSSMETIGINTPEELRLVAAHLAARVGGGR
jgi:bifunctional UDP-N-acetylglucosamine pyrophosphorylase/glucosamine-1-phosphate N-acetyltransferase